MRITDNFSLEELTKTNQQSANVPNAIQIINLCRLAFYFLQPLRNLIANPLDVICAFRSVAVNKAVGGANNSQHLSGQACDINCSSMPKFELFKLIAEKLDFDQLIFELDSNCLHVSYVDSKQNRRQILVRKRLENGTKKYFQYTEESLREMTKI